MLVELLWGGGVGGRIPYKNDSGVHGKFLKNSLRGAQDPVFLHMALFFFFTPILKLHIN